MCRITPPSSLPRLVNSRHPHPEIREKNAACFPFKQVHFSAEKGNERVETDATPPETERSTLHVGAEQKTNDGPAACPCIFYRCPRCLDDGDPGREPDHVAAVYEHFAKYHFALLADSSHTRSDPFQSTPQAWRATKNLSCSVVRRDWTPAVLAGWGDVARDGTRAGNRLGWAVS